jgi:hypothetical protein
LYDLFGLGFTLLALDDVEARDLDAAVNEARAAGVPMDVLRLRDPVLRDLYQAKRALIRPDQHVAWRGDVWPANGLLAVACGRSPPHSVSGVASVA